MKQIIWNIIFNGGRTWSVNDPTMKLQNWTRPFAELTFHPSATHFVWKNKTFRAPAIYQHFLPHVAPATKRGIATSPNVALATKRDTVQHHQMLPLPWKVAFRHVQMLRLPRKVPLQHHQILRLPRQGIVGCVRNYVKSHLKWEELGISHPPVRRGCLSRFGEAFCIWTYYISRSGNLRKCHTKCCVCHEKWGSNITKCCTCHEKWRSMMMRLLRKVALQHHQMLRLPWKVTLQHRQWWVMWDVMCDVVRCVFRDIEWRAQMWCEWQVMGDVSNASDSWCEMGVMWCEMWMWVMCDVVFEWCGEMWCERWVMWWDVVVLQPRNSEVSQLNFPWQRMKKTWKRKFNISTDVSHTDKNMAACCSRVRFLWAQPRQVTTSWFRVSQFAWSRRFWNKNCAFQCERPWYEWKFS